MDVARILEDCKIIAKESTDATAKQVRQDLAESLAPKRKSKGTSPTQRSLKHMRALGYLCDIVERRVPFQFVTKDLFGFIDILCVKGEDIIGVQATSGANVASRVTKIVEHENYPQVIKAMRIVIHGWRRSAAGRWTLREVEL